MLNNIKKQLLYIIPIISLLYSCKLGDNENSKLENEKIDNNNINVKDTGNQSLNSKINIKKSNIKKKKHESPETILSNTSKLNNLLNDYRQKKYKKTYYISGNNCSDDQRKITQEIKKLIFDHNCSFEKLDKENAELLLLWTIKELQLNFLFSPNESKQPYLDNLLGLLKNKKIDINKSYNGYPLLLYAINNELPSHSCNIIDELTGKRKLGISSLPDEDIYIKAIKAILKHPKLNVNIISKNCKNDENNGFNALTRAVQYNKIEVVKELLKHKDIDINQKTFDGNSTAMLTAILLERFDIIKLLLENKKIDLNAKFQDEGYPLLSFLLSKILEIYNNFKKVDQELNKNFSKKEKSVFDELNLYLTTHISDILKLKKELNLIKNKDIFKIKKELDFIKNVLSKNKNLVKSWFSEMEKELKEFKKRLDPKLEEYKKKNEIDIKDFGTDHTISELEKLGINNKELKIEIKEYKKCKLSLKLLKLKEYYYKNLEVLNLFVNHKKTKINLQTDKNKWSAIDYAASIGDGEVLDLFLKHKNINLSLTDSTGDNVLLQAAYKGKSENIKLLLKDPRVKINHKNNKGQNALDIVNAKLKEIKNDPKIKKEEKKDLEKEYKNIITLLKKHKIK